MTTPFPWPEDQWEPPEVAMWHAPSPDATAVTEPDAPPPRRRIGFAPPPLVGDQEE